VIGQMASLDKVVYACGKSGVFQPDDAMTFFSDTSDFMTIKEENPYSVPLSTLESAIARVQGDLSGRVAPSTMEMDDMAAYVEEFTAKAAEMSKRRSELTTKAEAQNRDIEQFEHFRGLNIDLDSIIHCETIKVRFGRLPKDSFEKLNAYSQNPYVLFFPGASDAEYYWGVYFAPLEMASDIDRIFSSLYFERLRIPSAVGTPEEIVGKLRTELNATNAALDQVKKEIADYWAKEKNLCLQVHARYKQLATLFGGIILFVSGLNWMDPEINPLVPVLKSPWLMFHVAVIVAAYGFFGISCLIGLTNMVMMSVAGKKNKEILKARITELSIVGEMALWVGLALMTVGTFLGAVWANESWGRYWGWDPKETWALITMVVYAVVTHLHLVKRWNSLWLFNLASVIAFASVLMTFFGVNYFLSGMHSYGQNDNVHGIFTYLYIALGVVVILAVLSYRRWKMKV